MEDPPVRRNTLAAATLALRLCDDGASSPRSSPLEGLKLTRARPSASWPSRIRSRQPGLPQEPDMVGRYHHTCVQRSRWAARAESALARAHELTSLPFCPDARLPVIIGESQYIIRTWSDRFDNMLTMTSLSSAVCNFSAYTVGSPSLAPLPSLARAHTPPLHGPRRLPTVRTRYPRHTTRSTQRHHRVRPKSSRLASLCNAPGLGISGHSS